ncbi:FAD-dependent oxidoreductase [Streptomyces sp. NPDC091972]|uniref:FAD-dependent oxidoreductase n=1 Tax=Streptomyces sp. NPDC091972 TaxID=3366007 RepID=UPI0037FB5A22
MNTRQLSERTADLVVIGSGIAGLSAAVEAAEAGLSVQVLEAAETVGGASAMSGAACFLVDTPLQREQGIDDNVELALADWKLMGGPTADLEWARRYVTDSARDVYQWCADLGIQWNALDQPEGNTVPRWHLPVGWGRRIIDVVQARAEELGVAIRTGVTVNELLHSAGRITGVRTSTAGHEEILDASAVAVCTGGFIGNIDQVLKHAPQLRELPRVLAGGSPTAIGLGHDLLAACDAQFTHLDHLWVYPYGTPDPTDPSGARGLGIRFRGVSTEIWLNTEGRRFHNEFLRGGYSGTKALLSQPGSTAWMVFAASEAQHVMLIDNEYYGTPAGPHPSAMEHFWANSKHVRTGDDPVALARAAGLPTHAVIQALDDFNAAVRSGAAKDPLTGRPLAGLEEVNGKLVAIQLFPMAQKNLGGVRTGLECEVLDSSGEPIKGLYAAGEVAGMAGGHLNGQAALEGTMFGPCIYSGRIAGRAVARRAR